MYLENINLNVTRDLAWMNIKSTIPEVITEVFRIYTISTLRTSKMRE